MSPPNPTGESCSTYVLLWMSTKGQACHKVTSLTLQWLLKDVSPLKPAPLSADVEPHNLTAGPYVFKAPRCNELFTNTLWQNQVRNWKASILKRRCLRNKVYLPEKYTSHGDISSVIGMTEADLLIAYQRRAEGGVEHLNISQTAIFTLQKPPVRYMLNKSWEIKKSPSDGENPLI